MGVLSVAKGLIAMLYRTVENSIVILMNFWILTVIDVSSGDSMESTNNTQIVSRHVVSYLSLIFDLLNLEHRLR